MKREEKNQKTLESIFNSAIKFFGEKGYDGTSINDITKDANISKGIVYHYFKNKDELYIYCLEKTLDSYVEFIDIDKRNDISVDEFLSMRGNFFREYPQYKSMFQHVILEKPSHLQEEIKEKKVKLFEINRKVYSMALEGITLGQGVEKEDTMRFLEMIQYSTPMMFGEEESNEDACNLFKIFINGLSQDLKERK